MINKKLRAKINSSFLTIVLTLALQINSTANSNASEPCFSTIPDSAWSNGQPENLPLSLNILLSSYKFEYTNIAGKKNTIIYKVRIEAEPAFISEGGLNLKRITRSMGMQPGTAFQATYSYEGKNCTNRNVTVDFSAEKNFKDVDLVLDEASLNGIELDYKTVNSIFKALQFVSKLTESSTAKKPFATFPLNPDYAKQIESDRNVVTRASVGLTGRILAALKKSPHKSTIGYLSQNFSFESESTCITFGAYPDPGRGFKTTLALAPRTYLTTPNYESLIFSSAQTCKVKVLYRVPSPQSRGLNNYISLGSFFVQGTKKVPKLVFYYN